MHVQKHYLAPEDESSCAIIKTNKVFIYINLGEWFIYFYLPMWN